MLTRTVYRARVSTDGEVDAVIAVTAEWSPRAVSEVIADLAAGTTRYVVEWESGSEPLVVIDDSSGRRVDAAGPDGQPGGLKLLPPG